MSSDELTHLKDELRRYKGALERYFPADIAGKILSEESVYGLNGQNIDITVLFLDIRGSTKIAQKLQPSDFSEFLSQIFTDIMDLIYSNGGSVNKMLGDGILATFGAPVPSELDAQRAVKSAIEIMEYLETFNDVRPDYMDESVRCGIGIASGEVFAGYIGSVRRMEYTVLGDAVNIAARLESMTKELNKNIVMDENTKSRAGGEFSPLFLGEYLLRGRDEAIRIYAVGDDNGI